MEEKHIYRQSMGTDGSVLGAACQTAPTPVPQQRRTVMRVLNSTLAPMETPTTISISASMQADPQYQQQCLKLEDQKPLKNNDIWLLVTWKSSNQDMYHAISASEIVGQGGQTIQTGKNILFRNGNGVIQAMIVLISDNKAFIDNELAQLQQMAAQNLETPPQRPSKNYQTDANGDRIIVPRVGRSMVAQQAQSRPMTFDQQTQTELRQENGSCPELSAQISELLEMQRANERQISLLLKQQSKILESTTSNRLAIEELGRQVAPRLQTSSEIVSQPPSYVYYEESSVHPKSPGLVIGEYREENGQLVQCNSSRLSFNETTNMSGSVNLTESSESTEVDVSRSGKKHFLTKARMSGVAEKPAKVTQLLKDWDEEGDSDCVYLGENKTRISREVFKNIDWSSYKGATRKLLISLFPREVLASHSLTGRPSPAFHDRNRPAKDKLDQKIIHDIILTVIKYCNVPESLVRTAITTKCADENKMSRQRMQKRKLNDSDEPEQEIKYQVKPHDKENLPSLSNSKAIY